MKTFNQYLSNIFDELETNNDDWGQFTDIEKQNITTFRELSVDKIFRKKNQPIQIDILVPIKEEQEEQEKIEDIETTKVYRNNVDIYNLYPKPIVIYLQYYFIAGLCGVMFIKLLLTI